MTDAVQHPPHYNSHPSGVECITVTEHFGFNLGNAMKYIWRADEKGKALEDLRKAVWYVEREIARREAEIRGCCSSCSGDGVGGVAAVESHGGGCWDCRGTGHAHAGPCAPARPGDTLDALYTPGHNPSDEQHIRGEE